MKHSFRLCKLNGKTYKETGELPVIFVTALNEYIVKAVI